MPKKRVTYFYDPEVGCYSYGSGHPMKPHRMCMAHNMISAYGMLDSMKVLRPPRATPAQMTTFHTDEYIEFLTRVTPETIEELSVTGQRFLAGEDNPAFEGLFEFCSISAGGSIGCAQQINDDLSDIAVNWAGGLHHAKKREASGFCYINDINLAILELLRVFPRVLYIDIDCHHGDGVEEAFYTTDRVLTCSFHKFGDYFPGTGHLLDNGMGKGEGYSINVPFKDGLTDAAFWSVFQPIVDRVLEWYRPSVVILQCGADSLAGDKLGCFNITMEGHARCVKHLRRTGIPLILLGGGGYTTKNVARVWTYETACALGVEDDLDRNLPFHDYFDWFGPRYRLEVPENNADDTNLQDGYLDGIREVVLEQLKRLPFAPSVQMQPVPRQAIAEVLAPRAPDWSGEREDDGKDGDTANEVDDRIQKIIRQTLEGRQNIEVDSASASEIEDAEDSDATSEFSPKVRPSLINGFVHDRYRPKRKFFRSSLSWDPLAQDIRSSITVINGYEPAHILNGWA